ncbi:MAG: 1,4-alpha-glucan branching protein GlgB [bacterium]
MIIISEQKTQLIDEQLYDILEARTHDPFSILGMHPVEGGKLRVNAFLPDAKKASVVPENEKLEVQTMKCVHPDGMFETVFPDYSGFFKYRLKIENHNGAQREFYDPYQFSPVLTDFDLHLIGEGKDYQIHHKLGCHRRCVDGVDGYSFAVWAPNAERVSVVGDFNSWDGRRSMMRVRGESGVWEIFLPQLVQGDNYKYEIRTKSGDLLEKSDPYAFYSELRPKTGSVVYGYPEYEWSDDEWMEKREKENQHKKPVNCYEVHLPSWRRGLDGEMLSYRELAHQLVDYLAEMNFTHVELMPVQEHPLDESWGYQVTGYYAPTSRLGKPEDFMYFVDYLHRHGFGVILDWVPGHFPVDSHGLAKFDGTHLYEYADPRKGFHPDWQTYIFNYSRHEVRNFLVANALFWLEWYHIDGLRFDAVASMLYLDYSREDGEWVPNKYGGRENLEAISFLQEVNSVTHERFPGCLTIAEESTDWGGVTRPVYSGGLGFDFKWNMGWMHDTLEYLSKNSIYRKFHQNMITFMLYYAFTENFILVLSHDEVVHTKGSLINKMPGDGWQQFANLRLLYGFQMAHPGKSLLFMGGEFAQRQEWRCKQSLDWHLLEHESHAKLKRYVSDLNAFYKDNQFFWQNDFDGRGFEWVDFHDAENSVISFIRRDPESGEHALFVFNFTPVPRYDYRVGLPENREYREIFNSDWPQFWGSGVENKQPVYASRQNWNNRPYSATVTLPPLGMTVLKPSEGH